MITAVYLRTSTEEQNPENQKRECLSLVEGEYRIFEEKQSAYKEKERKQFNLIKKEIKGRRIKKLVVWDLDRIERNRKRLIEFFEFCNLYKVAVISYRQQFLNTLLDIPSPFNEIMFNLMLQIMGWLAEEESLKKSERVKIAVRRKDGAPTKSYKGNRWGRKPLSTQKKNLILKMREEKKSIRQIAGDLKISIGAVHKTLTQFKQ